MTLVLCSDELFKITLTDFNAINSNMNGVEPDSSWSPVCTVSPIIIDPNQHVFTRPDKSKINKKQMDIKKFTFDYAVKINCFLSKFVSVLSHCLAMLQLSQHAPQLTNKQLISLLFTLKPQHFLFFSQLVRVSLFPSEKIEAISYNLHKAIRLLTYLASLSLSLKCTE